MLVNSKYIPHRWLKQTWKTITDDSEVVWIERANKSHAKYIAKYVGKSIEADLQPWEEWPVADELAGLRTCETFGGEERIRMRKVLDETERWAFVGLLSDYKRRAKDEEPLACLILNQLAENGDLDRLRRAGVESAW